MNTPWKRGLGTMLALALSVAACGGDDGARVRDLGSSQSEEDGGSGSASGSASGSSSASAPAGGAATVGEGGYEYASDVSTHRLVVEDICLVKDVLAVDPVDYGAIETIYRDGVSSVLGDGSVQYYFHTIDYELYQRLGARRDGLPVNPKDLASQ